MKKAHDDGKKVLSLWEKTAFGVGGAADNLMQNAINSMANQVFNIFLGMNPVLISLMIFCARVWDAFTDPTMGSISDNTRSRFGRRRPYIIAGGLIGAALFVLLWRVPVGWSHGAQFAWLLIGSLLFYTAYTVFAVPYYALGSELTPDYNERTSVMSYRAFFASSLGLSMSWMYRLTQLDCFENTLDGMQTVSLGVAVIMIISASIPALCCKERFAKMVSGQKKEPFWHSLKVTLKNRSFCLLLAVVVLTCLGVFMVNQLGSYINIFYVFGGDQKGASWLMGLSGTVYGVCGGLVAAPLVSWVSKRLGKKRTLMLTLACAAVGAGTKFFTFDPRWPYMQFLSLAIMAPGLGGLWILTPSMVADICDEDEVATNVRREGMYNAIYTNFLKIGISVGMLIVGVLLQVSGFRAELGAAQPEHSLFILRVCYSVVPVAGLLLGMVFVHFYPITEERAAATRALLDERHAKKESEKQSPENGC